ncbi:MAG TPA: TlpA family protein disulfide reductase [Caulobacteraceae bacterium]
MREILAPLPVAKPWRRANAALRGLCAAALVYAIAGCSKTPGDLRSLATGAMAKLTVTRQPAPAPTTVFADAAGQPHTLAQFRGKVTVVNIWANWCAPCKAEIPSLARLQRAYAGKPLAVVAISVGKDADETAGRAFIQRNPPLTFYTEPTYAIAYAFQPMIEGMPTTVIYDRAGVERARLTGGADWSGPDAKAVIDTLIAAR